IVGGLFLTGRALIPLQLAFERQRRFVADASHELRTPLTVIRLEAEEIADRLGANAEARPLLREVDRTSKVLDNLLVLARLDNGAIRVEREPVHAVSLLETVAAAARRLAATGVRVAVEADSGIWIGGDRDLLYQVLLILIDNA